MQIWGWLFAGNQIMYFCSGFLWHSRSCNKNSVIFPLSPSFIIVGLWHINSNNVYWLAPAPYWNPVNAPWPIVLYILLCIDVHGWKELYQQHRQNDRSKPLTIIKTNSKASNIKYTNNNNNKKREQPTIQRASTIVLKFRLNQPICITMRIILCIYKHAFMLNKLVNRHTRFLFILHAHQTTKQQKTTHAIGCAVRTLAYIWFKWSYQ